MQLKRGGPRPLKLRGVFFCPAIRPYLPSLDGDPSEVLFLMGDRDDDDSPTGHCRKTGTSKSETRSGQRCFKRAAVLVVAQIAAAERAAQFRSGRAPRQLH